jgi:hypothetical protein
MAATALATIVQCQLLAVDGLRLLYAGPQRLHHLVVVEVVHNVLQNVAVRLQQHKQQQTARAVKSL